MQDNVQNSAITFAEPELSAEKSKEIARFTKKRAKKRVILVAVVLVLAAVIATVLHIPKDTRQQVSVSALTRGELVNRLTLSGTVESGRSQRIYSTETGLVRQVYVQIGDRVEQGDLLCTLETEDIERAIKIQQVSMNNAAQKAAINLSGSQTQYQNLLDDLQTDKYAELVSAEQSLNYAQREYTDARHELDEHKDEQEYADEVVNGLERKLNLARIELSRAKTAYNNAVKAGAGVDEALLLLQEKEKAYDEIYALWDDANDEYGDVVTTYTKQYRLARLKYNDALENKEMIERSAARRLAELNNAVDLNILNSDMTAQRLELERLQASLAASSVTAPISGTVTAVYALEGMPGNGLLFVVEDTEQLVVKTAVREYDVTAIKPGMPALIKSDASGDQEWQGEVLRIAPAAVKSSNGSTLTGGNGAVSFDTDVALHSGDSALRIGMNVRLNIIIEKKDGVLSVPYDAVIYPDGTPMVLVARADEKGEYTALAVAVQPGMETDFYIEVTSDILNEGDWIITEPAAVKDGDAVRLPADTVR